MDLVETTIESFQFQSQLNPEHSTELFCNHIKMFDPNPTSSFFYCNTVTPEPTLQRPHISCPPLLNERSVAFIHTPSLFIQMEINGVVVQAAVDSGADISVISPEFCDLLKAEIHPTTMTLNSADGSAMACPGFVHMDIQLINRTNGHSTTSTVPFVALVATYLRESILIGRDFLQKFKVNLDFASKSVTAEVEGLTLIISPEQPHNSKQPEVQRTDHPQLPKSIREIILGVYPEFTDQSQVKISIDNLFSGKHSSLHKTKRDAIKSCLLELSSTDAEEIIQFLQPVLVAIPLNIQRRTRASNRHLRHAYFQRLSREQRTLFYDRLKDFNERLATAWTSVYPPQDRMVGSSTTPVFADDGSLWMRQDKSDSAFTSFVCRNVTAAVAPTETVEEQISPTTPVKKDLMEEIATWERLSDQQRKDMYEVLSVFDETTLRVDILPQVKLFTAKISLMDGVRPVKMKDRNWNPTQLEIIRRDINELLKQKWIVQCDGSWSARLVPVLKSDGSIRMCADYRALNDRTKTDAYPSANPDAIMDRLHGKKFFTKLDAMKGYYQVKLDETDQELTGFSCPFGFFKFTRMPFGLKNAPAIYQRMMDQILGDYKGDFADVLLDDILIYSDTYEEHLKHIQLVLARLKEHNVALRFDKCQFACSELYYLGHVINQDGKQADPDKIAAISKLAPPKTKKEVRSFLGMAGYLRRYIKDFSRIVKPLTDLTKSDVPDKASIEKFWTPECQKAFEDAKIALTTAPVLAHPDFKRPFIVECDASDYAVGAMLAQPYTDGNNRTINRPVAYASAKLNAAQAGYDATNREGLACVWACDKFEHYLKNGLPVTIITDHIPLTTMQTRKHAAQRIERWRQRLQEFNPIFVYRKGTDHHGPDTLSRLPREDEQETLPHDYDRISEIDVYNVTVASDENSPPSQPPAMSRVIQLWADKTLLPTWEESQRNDRILGPIIQYIRQGSQPSPEAGRTAPLYYLCNRRVEHVIREDGLLYLVDPKRKLHPLVAVPKDFVVTVLTMAHSDRLADGAHFSVTKTYQQLLTYCWWPRMYADVEGWIRDCKVCSDICQAERQRVQQVGTNLTPVKPMDVVAMDTITLPRAFNGSDKALVVIDSYSRFVWIFALSAATAEVIASILERRIFWPYGWPKILLSDSGTEFRNHMLREMCKKWEVVNRFTSIQHPQANGMVEGHNKVLLKMLKAAVNGAPDHWPAFIGEVSHKYNTTVIQDLDMSPYELMYGRKPVPRLLEFLPIQDPQDLTPQSTSTTTTDRATEATITRHQLRQNARDKANEKTNATLPGHLPGHLVMIHNNEYIENRKTNRDHKLGNLWIGPYVIVGRKPNEVSFRLRPLGGSTTVTLHATHLKPLYDLDGSPLTVGPDPDNIFHQDLRSEDEVGRRIATRSRPKLAGKSFVAMSVDNHRWENDQLQFFIEFQGFAKLEWHPEINLECPLLVQKYIQSLTRVSAIGKTGTQAK